MTVENIEDIVVLSPMQQLMLIHERAQPGSAALTGQFHYRLSGALQVPRLASAWQALVNRHAALRTCFLWDGLDSPVQVVRTELTASFAEHDLTTNANPEAALQELIEQDALQGIDVQRAPLARLVTIKLATDRWHLLLTRHHLILDRWALDLLFDELFTAYQQTDPSDTTTWPPAGRFKQYLAWVQRQPKAAGQTFWSEQLRGLTQGSRLLPDEMAAERDRTVTSLTFDTCSADALTKAAVNHGVSTATLLQAATALLLAHRVGQRDVVFALSVAARPVSLPSIENTMGSFSNTVPVRCHFADAEQTVTQWLQHLQQVSAQRMAHEHLSMVEIQTACAVPAGERLFDLLLLIDSPIHEQRTEAGFSLQQISAPQASVLPLTLVIDQQSAQLSAALVHSQAALVPAAAESLLLEWSQHLTQLLEHGLKQDSSTVEQLLNGIPAVTPPKVTSPVSDHFSQSLKTADDDDLETKLTKLFSRALGRQQVGLDDDFFALGGTSLQAAALFSAIEEEIGPQLSLATLFEHGNVRGLLEALATPTIRTSPMVALQPGGELEPLFTVPGIGGNVVGLHALARAFGPKQPFFAFESPGLDGHAKALERIEDIATRYVGTLPTTSSGAILLGVCWGAVVAFEMAQQLQAEGRTPAQLILIDPILMQPLEDTPVSSAGHSAGSVRWQFVKNRLVDYRQQIAGKSLRQQFNWLMAKLTRAQQMATNPSERQGTSMELARRNVEQANMTAQRHYRPQRYNGCAIVLMTTDREGSLIENDPRSSWRQYLPDGTREVRIPGATSGEAINRENAQRVADILSAAIQQP